MDKKQKPSQGKPAFRKFLLGDFSQHLQIPPAIIKNFNGKSLCKCTLRDPSGKCWSVKLENREDGLFFHNGWQGFGKDNFLEHGDALVFEYDGRSKFDVTIYDKTCCEKEVRVEIANGGGSDNLHKTSGKLYYTYPFRSSDYTYFITHLKKFRRYSMLIPKDVAIAEGLMSPQGLLNKETVMLQDSSGTSWLAKLNVRRDGRLLMQKGWTSCCSENQISVGDTIAFEFVKQGVMQLHVFRDKRCSVVLAGSQPHMSKIKAR